MHRMVASFGKGRSALDPGVSRPRPPPTGLLALHHPRVALGEPAPLEALPAPPPLGLAYAAERRRGGIGPVAESLEQADGEGVGAGVGLGGPAGAVDEQVDVVEADCPIATECESDESVAMRDGLTV